MNKKMKKEEKAKETPEGEFEEVKKYMDWKQRLGNSMNKLESWKIINISVPENVNHALKKNEERHSTKETTVNLCMI